MEQAGNATTAKSTSSQSSAKGYVIDEERDFALLDIARGLDALAQLCEDERTDMPEIPAQNWAALLRVFGRSAQEIHDNAGWTAAANIRSRH